MTVVKQGLLHIAARPYAAPIEDHSDDKWDYSMAVMLSAAYYLIRRSLPAMKKKGRLVLDTLKHPTRSTIILRILYTTQTLSTAKFDIFLTFLFYSIVLCSVADVYFQVAAAGTVNCSFDL